MPRQPHSQCCAQLASAVSLYIGNSNAEDKKRKDRELMQVTIVQCEDCGIRFSTPSLNATIDLSGPVQQGEGHKTTSDQPRAKSLNPHGKKE